MFCVPTHTTKEMMEEFPFTYDDSFSWTVTNKYFSPNKLKRGKNCIQKDIFMKAYRKIFKHEYFTKNTYLPTCNLSNFNVLVTKQKNVDYLLLLSDDFC